MSYGKNIIQIMFQLIKKTFIGLSISIVDASNHTKCVLFSNLKCTIPLIHLHPDEYNQEIRYYRFGIN